MITQSVRMPPARLRGLHGGLAIAFHTSHRSRAEQHFAAIRTLIPLKTLDDDLVALHARSIIADDVVATVEEPIAR